MSAPDPRPQNCRFRLEDEGKPYPRSSCAGCGRTTLSSFHTLGSECAQIAPSVPSAPETKPTHPIADDLRAMISAPGQLAISLTVEKVTQIIGALEAKPGCHSEPETTNPPPT